MEKMRKFYDKALKKYEGDKAKQMGYGNRRSQQVRFKVLKEIGIRSQDTVLDVGCGFGAFYKYLVKGWSGTYKGVDINPKVIEQIHIIPHYFDEIEFECKDILDVKERFDWVVSSGIFGIEFDGWDIEVEKILKHMYKLCRKGVAVNFLSALTPGKKYKKNAFSYPGPIISNLVTKITKNFVLRHDYRSNDFTIYMYKRKLR